jgi:hypothetical protein
MRTRFSLAIMAFALAGCAQIYQYQSAPGEQTATLKLGVEGRVAVLLSEIREDGVCPKKRMDPSARVSVIPVNKRLLVEPIVSIPGAYGVSTCSVPMGFTAQQGKEYFVVFEMAARGCTGRILTRDDAGRLVLAPTLTNEKHEECLI